MLLLDAEEQNEDHLRVMYKALDAMDLDDGKFIKLFRLNKELTQRLIEIVSPYLRAPSRASAININIKVGSIIFYK